MGPRTRKRRRGSKQDVQLPSNITIARQEQRTAHIVPARERQISTLTPKEMDQRFDAVQGNPAQLTRFLRRLATEGCPEHLASRVAALLRHPNRHANVNVRLAAVTALATLPETISIATTTAVHHALRDTVRMDSDPRVLRAAAMTFARYSNYDRRRQEVTRCLEERLGPRPQPPAIRRTAAEMLAWAGDVESMQALGRCVEFDDNAAVRSAARHSIMRIRARGGITSSPVEAEDTHNVLLSEMGGQRSRFETFLQQGIESAVQGAGAIEGGPTLQSMVGSPSYFGSRERFNRIVYGTLLHMIDTLRDPNTLHTESSVRTFRTLLRNVGITVAANGTVSFATPTAQTRQRMRALVIRIAMDAINTAGVYDRRTPPQ